MGFGATAFATMFFPGLSIEKLTQIVMMARQGASITDYLKMMTPQLVTISIFIVLPIIICFILFFAMMCLIPARLCCYTNHAGKPWNNFGRCCYYTQYAAFGVGLAGCLGLIIASAQPLIGITNAVGELENFTEKAETLAKNAEGAINTLLTTFITDGTKTLTDPFTTMMNMSADERRKYVDEISKNGRIKIVGEFIGNSSSALAAGISTLCATNYTKGGSDYSSIKTIEDFTEEANKKLGTVRDDNKVKPIIDDLKTRKAYPYFENETRASIKAADQTDVKINVSSLEYLNKNSTVGGAIFALNSVVNGINNSLQLKGQPPTADTEAAWKALTKVIAKQVFANDAAYQKYESGTSNPIPRTDLKVPKSSKSADVADFIKAAIKTVITDSQQQKLVESFIDLFTTEVDNLAKFIKSFCVSDFKDNLPICTGLTASSTDADIEKALTGMIVSDIDLQQYLRSIFTYLDDAIPYFSYIYELPKHSNQMKPKYLFDAFVNNGECPYFITGLSSVVKPSNPIRNCTLPFVDMVPKPLRSYSALTVVFPLLTTFFLFFPLAVFIMGIIGAACKNQCFMTISSIFNVSSIICLSLAFLIAGILAVIIGKLFVVQISDLIGSPEAFLNSNYNEIVSLINETLTDEQRKFLIKNISFDMSITEKLQTAAYPKLLYTQPGLITVNWTTYEALKSTGAGTICISNLGDVVGFAMKKSVPAIDPLHQAGIDVPLKLNTISIDNLFYYNESSADLFSIFGVPDLFKQLETVLFKLVNGILNLDSFLFKRVEAMILQILDPILTDIKKAINDQKFTAVNLFLDAKEGYSLFLNNYSTDAKRNSLYGSSVSSDTLDLYKLISNYLQKLKDSGNTNSALSLADTIHDALSLSGIKGECIALVQFIRGLGFAAGCNLTDFDTTIKYTSASSLDTLCAKDGIAAFMKSLRGALTTLEGSCAAFKAVLPKVFTNTLTPGDIEAGCGKTTTGGSQIPNINVTKCVVKVYPAYADALFALFSRGVTVFGWNSTIAEPAATNLFLDTMRAYERFTTVFTSWNTFNPDTVNFINCYSELIATIMSSLNILKDILSTNIMSTSLSMSLSSAFSPRFNTTIMEPCRNHVNTVLTTPLNTTISTITNLLIGKKGIVTPYTWEVIFNVLYKLLFGVGLLEVFGAVFLCLYFIWAGYFFGIISQVCSVEYAVKDQAKKETLDDDIELL